MITRPLNLEAHLSPPPRDVTSIAWVNVGVIALFFSLLGSRFVLAPGLLVELPKAEPSAITAAQTSAVIKLSRDNVIMFEGGIHNMSDLRARLEAYAKNHPGSVVQVNADRQVSAQALADLGAIVTAAGFDYILMASEPGKPENRPQ